MKGKSRTSASDKGESYYLLKIEGIFDLYVSRTPTPFLIAHVYSNQDYENIGQYIHGAYHCPSSTQRSKVTSKQ